jgi:hypothetical protein
MEVLAAWKSRNGNREYRIVKEHERLAFHTRVVKMDAHWYASNDKQALMRKLVSLLEDIDAAQWER